MKKKEKRDIDYNPKTDIRPTEKILAAESTKSNFIFSHHILPILIIFSLALTLYANTLKNGFVYDDDFTVRDNTLIKSFYNLPTLFQKDFFPRAGEGTYRPTVTFTYFLDYSLYGLNPYGYHLTNSCLHAVNAVLLYIFLTLVIGSSPDTKRISLTRLSSDPIFITSLFFAAHPILTEAVNGISFREDLLTFLFYIAALILYIILRTPVNKPAATITLFSISCVLYFIALLSKEMALTFPLILICYDWILGDGKSRPKPLFNSYHIGYLSVTLIYVYARFFYFKNPVGEEVPSQGLFERLSTIPWLIISYLKLTLFPISLSADYVIEPVKSITSSTYAASAIILLLAMVFRSKSKMIIFGAIFFLIALIPVYSLIPIGNPLAERYLYLPLIGLLFIIISIAKTINKNLITGTTMILHIFLFYLILGIFTGTTINRNMIWRNDYSLWSDTIKKMPLSSRAHNNLGLAYVGQRRYDEAFSEFQVATMLKPSNYEAHNNLGGVFFLMGQFELAIQEFQKALKYKTAYPEAHFNMGNVYAEQGRLDEAIAEYQSAIRLRPSYTKAHYKLGLSYKKIGELRKAKTEMN